MTWAPCPHGVRTRGKKSCGLPLVGPLWRKGYRPRVRPKWESKGTKRLAALLHGVQTIYTHDNKEPTIRGSLDLAATQVAQATIVFQQALLPHPLWLGPLPVCLAEYHQGKVDEKEPIIQTIHFQPHHQVNNQSMKCT